MLRYVTRQLFRQFWSDQFISKLSITVAVYFSNLNNTMQTKQNAMKNHTHIQIETIFSRNFTLW